MSSAKKDTITTLLQNYSKAYLAFCRVAEETSEKPEKTQDNAWKKRLTEAAREVFARRDALGENPAAIPDTEWDRIIQDMANLGATLAHHGIKPTSGPQ